MRVHTRMMLSERTAQIQMHALTVLQSYISCGLKFMKHNFKKSILLWVAEWRKRKGLDSFSLDYREGSWSLWTYLERPWRAAWLNRSGPRHCPSASKPTFHTVMLLKCLFYTLFRILTSSWPKHFEKWWNPVAIHHPTAVSAAAPSGFSHQHLYHYFTLYCRTF